jgi:putative membrane protein
MPGKVGSIITSRKGSKKGPKPFVMVPHSASTHDMNPSTSNQAIKLGAQARKMLDQVEYSPEATRFSRQGKEVSVCSQSFGDSLVVIHDPSSRPRDDLDQYIGKEVTKHARREGIDNALFIDAHNCIEPGSENVHHHTPAGESVVELSEMAIERSKASKRDPFKMGYAHDKDFTVEGHSIGPAGIQVMVIEIGEQRTAYVLLDGNNIVSKVAEKIRKTLDIVNRSVIMTTDNHIANVTMGGYNPIGMKIGTKELTRRVTAVVEQAIDDLEDCEAGGASDSVMIRVFGPGATARMTATINSTMSVMKLGAASGLALSFTGTVVWYQLLTYLGYL